MPSLKSISKEVARCRECKKNKFGLPVPGDGNPRAKIMLIGEAPGRNEAKVGRPFVGRGGKLLTKLLVSIGLERKDVFITSPVKYYPGQRTPNDSEIAHGRLHLLKQVAVIKPKIIVLMGKVAHKALTGDAMITRVHGRIIKKDGILYFSTFHPAAALRFPRFLKLMRVDFKKLARLLRAGFCSAYR